MDTASDGGHASIFLFLGQSSIFYKLKISLFKPLGYCIADAICNKKKACEARAKGDELGEKEGTLWEEAAAIYENQADALEKRNKAEAEQLKNQAQQLMKSIQQKK